MTDKPKLGWLVMEESHLGAMVLGFYTEKHKAMAAAEGYAEKHYVRLGGLFFGPSIIPVSIDCPIDD